MPGRFSVTLIGEFRVHHGGRLVDLPPSCQKVIALAALAGRPVHRLWACSQLWPDIPSASASARLRTTLWRLRPMGADGLFSVDAKSLSLAAGVHVDWRRAVELCESLLDGRATPGRPDADVVDELLPILQRGALLDGWTDHWNAGERTRYHGLRLSALGRLA
ncbi:AfsR/SARP family transcriptional regulator [Mycolicibacterium komossense]|uniref:Transcriptional regulator n=1 Tax=Mycolicibacterium komossense TaxID=1779 RepID=A0ABT3CK56_9MYCO|nr:transcriptional regulator [Mycolicibacterium komossense]MCV7229896.1 transcriptional regulator [Mycolicibacterium komossense]